MRFCDILNDLQVKILPIVPPFSRKEKTYYKVGLDHRQDSRLAGYLVEEKAILQAGAEFKQLFVANQDGRN